MNKNVNYFLLEKSDIINKKINISLPKIIVYFLINDNEIVYVGHITRGLYRFFEHDNLGKKFDSYYFIEVPKANIRRIEEHYIKEFKPIYNIINK